MENNHIDLEVRKRPSYLHMALIIAIVIVTNLFFNYVISLVYTEPMAQNYCPAETYNKVYTSSEQCLANGGMWSEQVVPGEINPNIKTPTPVRTQVTGYCNATYSCEKKYETASHLYNRNIFIILVALGVTIIALGAYIGIPMLTAAFAWSGVLSILIASLRYWGNAGSLIRVLILGAALAALIWLAVKKFNK